ncbi:hypothetical protein G7054_g6510 [Neopestalotiopsis clavispora]|nr:hypothetical protein G7054_g6510 [Neopestalotiopsis clavispora]
MAAPEVNLSMALPVRLLTKPFQDMYVPDMKSAVAVSEDRTTVDKERNGDATCDTLELLQQKRRRVTRACDECKRRKIKYCEKQPYTYCHVRSYVCTYDKSSSRHRNHTPQDIEALENRLQRVESLLMKLMSDLDPVHSIAERSGSHEQTCARAATKKESSCSSAFATQEPLLSVGSSAGQLEINDEGGYEFQGTEDGRELALLYSFLALGSIYNAGDDENPEEPPHEIANKQGLQYSETTQLLLQDISDCRDLTSLQTLLLMILFLQSTLDLSTCYDFLGIALRSALRLGLHQHIPHYGGTTINAECRRRVFSVCLSNGHPMPTPVDDELSQRQALHQFSPGSPSLFEAFNAHAKLMDILKKVTKSIYPLERIKHDVAEDGQMILPSVISYYKMDELSYVLGIVGVNAARDIVRMAMEMRQRVSPAGPFWFTLLTEFLATITLVSYVLDNGDKPETPDIMADAAAVR